MAILSSPLQLISSTPLTTRSFTAATIGFSLLYYLLVWQGGGHSAVPYLTLVPGSSFFYPWTFVTAGLVEVTVLELIFSVIFVPASLRYFERLWGSVETAKFILVVTAIPNLMSFVINWAEFVIFRDPDLFLFGMEYHGQMALQAAILVAFTQVIPEHQLQIGVIKVRMKRLPMAYVTLSTVMVLIGYQSPWINIQWGWLVGWLYLRFYKKNKGDSVVSDSYGDRSETFAFVIWFPPFLHTPIGILGNFVHSLCSRLHLIPGVGSDVESGGYSQLPGGPRAEAERRRALALKALDQRLASAAAPPKELVSKSALHSADPGSPAASDAPEIRSTNPGKDTHERRKSILEVDLGVADHEGKGKGKIKADAS